MKYRVLVTREVTFTQSGYIEVDDVSGPYEAREKAVRLAEENHQSNVEWEDDGDGETYHYSDVYVADPTTATEKL